VKKDHRPYYLKKINYKFEQWYAYHFLAPQCEYFGRGMAVMKPWHVEIFGSPISIGDFNTLIATSDKKVRLSAWLKDDLSGKIEIGRCCLICPGVRITSATSVVLGDDCMLAQDVYITDSDWHDLYDRTSSVGNTSEVKIGNNVWIGDSAIVGKGVTIGDNAVVGAGAIVVKDIPANAIAAGNPATVIRYLDAGKTIKSRSQWMAEPDKLTNFYDNVERVMREGNTLFGWLRTVFFPRKGD
jgi:acetyltransferase-like isoleucine patch superfamily enzyme